jgi:hypothetical protein
LGLGSPDRLADQTILQTVFVFGFLPLAATAKAAVVAVQLQVEQALKRAAFKHLSEHEAHEVQFALAPGRREADRPIKEQAWKAYAPYGQIELRHPAEGIRRSQSGRAA